MLTKRVIPCLDVRGGRVVKGVQFVAIRDAGEPAALAERYAADGADEVVILDISATAEERGAAVDVVRAVRARIAIPLTVGGGIRSESDATRLLDAGADKVALNTAAYANPALVTALARRFGSQCVTVSVDAKASTGGWRAVVRAGAEATSTDAIEWASRAEALGAGEILLTSVDRDGTQQGYDLDLIRAVTKRVCVPVVASGGARTGCDLVAGLTAGAHAVLAASILHDGVTTVGALKQSLANAGFEVRR